MFRIYLRAFTFWDQKIRSMENMGLYTPYFSDIKTCLSVVRCFILDFCPNAREIISGEGMTRGTNNIVAGSIVPKYKISIGKLRKGFLPNQSHKSKLLVGIKILMVIE